MNKIFALRAERMIKYTEEDIVYLKNAIAERMSDKRYSHTLGVERCARKLGELIIPGQVDELRVAALLHDVSKEIPLEEQLNLLGEVKYPLNDIDLKTKGIIHSFSAPYVIKRDFPQFASDNVLSAVEKHTVGSADMTLFDMIVFISDYIEDTRPYTSCIALREYMFCGIEALTNSERVARLFEVCLKAIKNTEKAISDRKDIVNPRMLAAKEYIEKKILQI